MWFLNVWFINIFVYYCYYCFLRNRKTPRPRAINTLKVHVFYVHGIILLDKYEAMIYKYLNNKHDWTSFPDIYEAYNITNPRTKNIMIKRLSRLMSKQVVEVKKIGRHMVLVKLNHSRFPVDFLDKRFRREYYVGKATRNCKKIQL